MRALPADLPAEIVGVDSAVTPDGANVTLQLAEGVTPRFYQNSSRQFVLDIDIAGQSLPSFRAAELAEAVKVPASAGPAGEVGGAPRIGALQAEAPGETVKPFVNVVGSDNPGRLPVRAGYACRRVPARRYGMDDFRHHGRHCPTRPVGRA
ncbi:hypothetical protein N8D56_14120 [Devosia sp. A8/3-2]|nr:hypothetical protein N8D56_14120 [Devosia sp. A8/3-2]